MTLVVATLTRADRKRLLEHLDDVGDLDRLMRQPGGLPSVPEPVPLHRGPRRNGGRPVTAEAYAEPLTPVAVEAKLRWLVSELTRAQEALRKARDDEVDAKHAHDAARRRALLSEKSPRVTRGGYTTAERDAWVDDQVADLRFDYDKAIVIREAAVDRLRVLLSQAEIVRSLGASVRQAFEIAGTTG